MKYFRWTEDYILNSSWQKMVLYSMTIPVYKSKSDKEENLSPIQKITKQLEQENTQPQLTPMGRILGF